MDDMLAQAASVSRGLIEQRRVFDSVQVRPGAGCWARASPFYTVAAAAAAEFTFFAKTAEVLTASREIHTHQDKLFSVGEKFPVVNGLLNAIRRKKSKVCVCVCAASLAMLTLPLAGSSADARAPIARTQVTCLVKPAAVQDRACTRGTCSCSTCTRSLLTCACSTCTCVTCSRIHMRMQLPQDTLVLSGVIAACTVLMLLYIMAK